MGKEEGRTLYQKKLAHHKNTFRLNYGNRKQGWERMKEGRPNPNPNPYPPEPTQTRTRTPSNILEPKPVPPPLVPSPRSPPPPWGTLWLLEEWCRRRSGSSGPISQNRRIWTLSATKHYETTLGEPMDLEEKCLPKQQPPARHHALNPTDTDEQQPS